MADRPCKPSADVKRLWQMFLPGTPFPACGPDDDSAKAADETVVPQQETTTDRHKLDRKSGP